MRIFEGSLEIEIEWATHKHTNKDIHKHIQSQSKDKKGVDFWGFRVYSIRPATNMKAEVKTSQREAREKETIKA